MKTNLLWALPFLVVMSCSTLERPATPEEMIEAQTRLYPTLTPEQVFVGAEKMFILADEWAVQMVREKHRLKVTRSITVLILEGYMENWEILALPMAGGTEVTVSVELEASVSKIFPRDVGTYHFFFSRLEYLTGLSQKWMTCDQYEAETRTKPNWANDGYLCNHADDINPNSPLTAQWPSAP